jgi:aquaglyceroporin related protein
VSSASAFFSEFLATAILSMVVLALTDEHRKNKNMLKPALIPLALFILFIGVGTSLGMQTCGCYFFQSFRFMYP